MLKLVQVHIQVWGRAKTRTQASQQPAQCYNCRSRGHRNQLYCSLTVPAWEGPCLFRALDSLPWTLC